MLDRVLSSAARRVKAIGGFILYKAHAHKLLRRDEAVIVVFHRVNESYPNDPLTLTNAQFEKFVGFFGKYFDVVPLSRLLTDLENNGDLKGKLAITFDDGYWGNATIAAPILERYGQRACFFVTTDWMGTDHVPWWDAEKSIKTQWMTWDQVRDLRRAGHDVGFHTKSHPDLGVVSPEAARAELSGSSAHLDAELGEHSGMFAYPFGGKKNMSEANQAVIDELGLRCSLSAYGGTVRNGDDARRLKRITVSSWFVSPYQFGFEYLLGQLDSD
jgi:peptidoglycan/xylan/chitin deacetylase (PgdA/CDA1 family)